MKPRIKMVGLLGLSIMLMSVSTVKENNIKRQAPSVQTIPVVKKYFNEKPPKTTLINRLIARLVRRYEAKTFTQEQVDKLADISLILGSLSIVALIAGIIIPSYVLFLLVFPLGITAIVTGSGALKRQTKKEISARLGKGFGYGAIGAVVLLLILATIILLSSDWW